MIGDVLATLLATAVNAIDDGVILLTVNPRRPQSPIVAFINRAFTRLTGHTQVDAPPAWLVQALHGTQESHEAFQAHDDGTVYRLECRVTPIALGSDAPTHYMCVLRDRTSEEAHKSARRLARLEALWKLVARAEHSEENDYEMMREGIRGVDAEYGILTHAEGDEVVCDYVLGSGTLRPGDRIPMSETIFPHTLAAGGTIFCDDVGDEPVYGNLPVIVKAAVRSFISTTVSCEGATWALTFYSRSPRLRNFDGEDRAYVELLGDFFARKIDRRRKDAQLAFLAYHDPLTALPNRAAFFERVDGTIAAAGRRGRKCAVLYFDLDHFKDVNDSLGHRAGDRILSETAHRLRRIVRKDEFVARLGGDEFATLLPEVDGPADAQEAAGRIADELNTPFMIEGELMRLSASIGVALYPIDGEDRESLIAHADAAMYRSKQDGRNRTRFYSQTIGEDLHRRRTLLAELRSAFANNELAIHYQPLIDPLTERCISVEALVRWEHPTRGLLEPPQFLDIAREGNMLPAIDRWSLHEVAVQSQEWQQRGLRPRVSLNVAYETISAAGGLDEMLSSCTFPMPGLCLEMTQHALGYAMESCTDIFTQCKDRGITILLDDFGGPTSTLFNIADLPVDALKIDRRCMQNVPYSPSSVAIFAAILKLGRALGYAVYGKGVEESEQRRWLGERGCDGVQGFAIARAMPARAFETWLKDHNHVAV